MAWSSASSSYGYSGARASLSLSPPPPPPYLKSMREHSRLRCLPIRFDDIAAVAHNKVLLGAAVSAAIGQLSKPWTRALLYGDDFDPKSALQAGGFPSSHSSAVAATATALALERGLSDSIFGLSVVYAGLVMYDAQGVRREVGNHAKTINQVLRRERAFYPTNNDDDNDDDLQHYSDSFPVSGRKLPEEAAKQVTANSRQAPAAAAATRTNQMLSVETSPCPPPWKESLKESVGHSEIEVIAGAVLGVSVSLALHYILLPYYT